MTKEFISRDGHKKLYDEYIGMDQKIAEVQRKMGESAKIDNDLRENSEYMSLRVEAMYTLPDKKRTLYKRYRDSIIIEETEEYINFDGKTVIIGSEVELIMNGKKEKYKILGNSEGNPKNFIISCVAPIAKLILNKHIGETVKFNDSEITILSVKRI